MLGINIISIFHGLNNPITRISPPNTLLPPLNISESKKSRKNLAHRYKKYKLILWIWVPTVWYQWYKIVLYIYIYPKLIRPNYAVLSSFRNSSPVPPPAPTRPKTVNITVKGAKTSDTPSLHRKSKRTPSTGKTRYIRPYYYVRSCNYGSIHIVFSNVVQSNSCDSNIT